MRRVATVMLLVALVWPVIQNRDGLPLSTYPMYAGERDASISLITAVGIADDGAAVALSMRQIADTLDPLIAQSFLNDAVASGRVERVCAEIASRVGRAVAGVEIAREQRDVVAHMQDRPSLDSRQVIVRCQGQP